MTTTVKVETHCNGDLEVQVVVHLKDGTILEEFKLQDGEKAERHVFDARFVTVTEVFKQS